MESKTLYIFRGTPGSGKSTLAPLVTPYIVETDDFFINEKGEYLFDTKLVPASHQWALERVRDLMEEGRERIAVLDAFIRLKTMEPYKRCAEQMGYSVIEILVKSSFQNVHGIDEAQMDEIRRAMEYTPWPDSNEADAAKEEE